VLIVPALSHMQERAFPHYDHSLLHTPHSHQPLMLKRTAVRMAQTKLRIGFIPGKRNEQASNHTLLQTYPPTNTQTDSQTNRTLLYPPALRPTTLQPQCRTDSRSDRYRRSHQTAQNLRRKPAPRRCHRLDRRLRRGSGKEQSSGRG
jgi:hypothetical protein